jgi:pyrroline-5-carboxylate reductase
MSVDTKPAKPAEAALVEPGRTLGVVGAGVMGQTLLRGLIERGAISREYVWASARTQATCERVAAGLGISVTVDVRKLVPGAGLILVCVKPGQAARVLAQLRDAGLRPDTLMVSIMAGTTLAQLEAMLATENPWVRAMPNTPCIVGEGMTVVCGASRATSGHVARAQSVFEAVGRAIAVDETYFNAITALSGSGPAYQYLIMEALADAGVRVGLPRQLALTLVAQTVLGAAKMVQATGRHPAALRDDVTTPAGCTIAGLLMLEDGKIRSVLARAIEEATKTAGHLAPPAAK